MNGLYRPCGRPFINHLVGTASVLLFYGCPVQVVIAGLLHAIFTHGQGQRSPETHQTIENEASLLGSAGRHAVKMAKLYPARQQVFQSANGIDNGVAELPLDLAELYLLDAANDVEMHLSLEVAVSGRGDVLVGKRLRDSEELVEFIGLSGLAETLQMVRDQVVTLPIVNFQGGRQGSFQLL
jgi:hypothetical protein